MGLLFEFNLSRNVIKRHVLENGVSLFFESQAVNMLSFQSLTTLILSGTTGSGKTTWLKKLIAYKKQMFSKEPLKILYFYGVWQPMFEDMEKWGVQFVKGLPQDLENDSGVHMLVVLDDLQDEVTKSDHVENLFTRGSHHKNITVVYLTQNLFRQGKSARNIALNAHYVILFKNPRDIGQIGHFGRQLGCSNFLKKAFQDATDEKYGYLIVDLSPHLEEQYRFRTKIWPDEDTIVYRPL